MWLKRWGLPLDSTDTASVHFFFLGWGWVGSYGADIGQMCGWLLHIGTYAVLDTYLLGLGEVMPIRL